MNFRKILKLSFNKDDNHMATIAVIGGVAVGVAIGVLFATKKGKHTKRKIIDFFSTFTGTSLKLSNGEQLGSLVENARERIKQNADRLLGSTNKRNDVSEIQVDHTPTTKWKEQKEKTIFPDEPNPRLN